MKFKLYSKFKPTGDQPQAIKKLVDGYKKHQHQTLLGVTGSGKTFTMANVIEKLQKPTLVLAHNKTLAAQLYGEFKTFFPNNKVCYFISYYDYYQPESYLPQTDTYIEKDTSINEKIEQLRLETATALIERQDVIVVASVSCIYGLGSPENFNNRVIKISVNQNINRDDFIKDLISIQFERNDTELFAGKFQVRGETINLTTGDGKTNYRIDFFDDKIEKISFSKTTGRIIDGKRKTTTELFIFPAKPFIYNESQSEIAIKSIQKELEENLKKIKDPLVSHRLKQKVNYDIEMIKELGYCNGIENYSRHFDGRKPGEKPYTLLDYFKYDVTTPNPFPNQVEDRLLKMRGGTGSPSLDKKELGMVEKKQQHRDFLFIIDESHVALPQVHGMYKGDFARKRNLVEYGFRLPSAYDNRPLKFDEFEKYLTHTIYTSATPGDYELKQSKQIAEQIVRPTGIIDPEIFIRPIDGQMDNLLNEIEQTIKQKNRILVTTLTKKMAEDLTDYLLQHDIKAKYLHSEIDTLKRSEIIRELRIGKFDVLVGINLLREGLDIPEVGLVAILDADKEGFLRNERSLIQTIGRAARNVDSKVILYADKKTGSIKKAIKETNRRRKIQVAYNEKHNITPQNIKRDIEKNITKETKQDDVSNKKKIKSLGDVKKFIIELETQMNLSADELDFEKAIELRDKIKSTKENWGL